MPLYKGDVHVDKVLTNMALGYTNAMFVADALFPRLKVAKDSDKYFVFGTVGERSVFGHANSPAEAFVWEDGTDWNVISDGRTTQSYTCVQRAAADVVTNTELRNQDAPLNAFRDHTAFIVERLRLELEKLAATKATTQGNYKSTNRTQLSGSSQWSDQSGTSNPYGDIITGQKAIRQSIGRPGNTFLCSAVTWEDLIQHPDITERIKYTSENIPNEQRIAAMFGAVGIERVVVAGAIKNTADQGQTESISDVWGKHAVLAYVPSSPGIGTPSYGYRFNSSNDVLVARTVLDGKNATLLNAVSRDAFEFVCQDGSADSIGGYLIEDAVA
tara:strand:- start:664 stop:1650 length:987 start_codon:yes stop_codon:yes gene_type:complete